MDAYQDGAPPAGARGRVSARLGSGFDLTSLGSPADLSTLDDAADPGALLGAAPVAPAHPMRTGARAWSGQPEPLSLRERAQIRSVWLRWLSQWLWVVMASLVSSAAMRGTSASAGGTLQLCGGMFLLAMAAFGVVAFAGDRKKLIDAVRGPMVSVTAGGTSIAVVVWLTQHLGSGNRLDSTNLFASHTFTGLTVAFVVAVVFPLISYARVLFAFRAVNRTRQDNEELVGVYTRQDGLQH